jgi:hypothetical protein
MDEFMAIMITNIYHSERGRAFMPRENSNQSKLFYATEVPLHQLATNPNVSPGRAAWREKSG